MPKRIPIQRIIVQRDGKQVVPEIGQAYDFTAEELDDINRMNPDAIRKVIVEDKALEAQLKADEAADAAKAKKVAEDAKKAETTTAKGTTKPSSGGADL